MRPILEDYYELEDPGCCLICDDAEEGCLCRNCKCSKCEHYSGNDPETALEYTDEGKRWCRLVEDWEDERQKKFAVGKESSSYQVNTILRESEKAVYCTLKKGNQISNSCLWIPRSVLSSKLFIDNWFVEKEDIKKLFNEGVESQSKLF